MGAAHGEGLRTTSTIMVSKSNAVWLIMLSSRAKFVMSGGLVHASVVLCKYWRTMLKLGSFLSRPTPCQRVTAYQPTRPQWGHVEGPGSWAKHLLALRELQLQTGGISEFVPLPFVHMESPIYLKGAIRKPQLYGRVYVCGWGVGVGVCARARTC